MSSFIYIPENSPTITGTATITGVLIVTQTLTADISGVTTTGNPTLSYQWYRGLTPIGTNSSTYTLVPADSGQTIYYVITATNTRGSSKLTSQSVTIFNTIADTYPTGAAHGWWLSLLRGSYYGQPLIRIRRQSDNLELDVSHGPTGYLDTDAISSFCGGTSSTGGTGFVTSVYDQLGGTANNFTQSTLTNQWRIFNRTTGIELLGTTPCFLPTAANHTQSVVGSGASGTFNFFHDGTPYTIYFVEGISSASSNSFILRTVNTAGPTSGILAQWNSTNRFNVLVYGPTGTLISNYQTFNNATPSNGTQCLISITQLNNEASAVSKRQSYRINGNISAGGNGANGATASVNHVVDLTRNGNYVNRKQGILIYKTDQNREAIEAIIRSQYNF